MGQTRHQGRGQYCLPEKKRFELEVLVQTIREEFDVEMIILFGSYARGDWVEEIGPEEELKWLGERVSEIQKMTEEKCRARIESFTGGA